MIVAHYIEVEDVKDLVRLQQELYSAGYCFIEGEHTDESLEDCEARVSPETAGSAS